MPFFDFLIRIERLYRFLIRSGVTAFSDRQYVDSDLKPQKSTKIRYKVAEIFIDSCVR